MTVIFMSCGTSRCFQKEAVGEANWTGELRHFKEQLKTKPESRNRSLETTFML